MVTEISVYNGRLCRLPGVGGHPRRMAVRAFGGTFGGAIVEFDGASAAALLPLDVVSVTSPGASNRERDRPDPPGEATSCGRSQTRSHHVRGRDIRTSHHQPNLSRSR
jgi:hypothetical protein